MSIEFLGNLGDFIGGAAVIATLIYLAIQTKQAKEASIALMNHELSKRFGDVTDLLGQNDLIGVWIKVGSGGMESLDKNEVVSLLGWFSSLTRVMEDCYFQWKKGYVSDDAWGARETYYLDCLKALRWDGWIESRRSWFDHEFADHVIQRLSSYEAVIVPGVLPDDVQAGT